MGKQMREHVFKKMPDGGAIGRVAKRVVAASAAMLCAVGITLGSMAPAAYAQPEPAAAFDTTLVNDAPTVNAWENIITKDTSNIGRIWTDKSVSSDEMSVDLGKGKKESVKKQDGSDFLVGLSALSSTSNTMKTVSKPLDIVLVMDVSGSMKHDVNSYVPVYSLSQWRTYYAVVDGEYHEVTYNSRKRQWGYNEGRFLTKWVAVTPKKSADDKTPDAVQFYEMKPGVSKMAALKAAASSFIDETEKNNASISDPAKRHHISLVKFADDSYKNGNQDSVGNNFNGSNYNYTQIVSNFTDNADALKASVNKLQPAGATAADYGLNLANRVLDVNAGHGARKDAQKVVILFTDGEPNHDSGFSNTVANNAIKSSKTLKDNGALVYSLCIFEQANPDDLSQNFNKYMHAVSSNYPQAQSLADMGARAENSNYYKAAVDADDLNKIFQEISDEIGSGTGFPTATEEGAAGTSGFITFTDKLGEYMQVDSFGKLIFGEKVFQPTSNPAIKQGTTTVTYEGTVENPLYPKGDLNQIKITIERSADLATGDVVTVKVPAGLIPLRKFDVDVKQGASTMNVAETYPLHVFYNVSLKPEVKDAIVGGLGDSPADAKLKTYIEKHLDSEGRALFYSNFYNKAKLNGALLGDTTATYAPAKGNSFYYFTEDTPIFREEACQNHVVGTPNPADTYYYQKPYYAKNPDGSVVEKQEIIRFKGSSFASLKEGKDWGHDADGNIVLKAGAARLTRVDDKVITKKDNTTQTASHATDPRWKNPNGPQDVVAYLGNNGRIALEMPSSLSITKDATVAPNKGLDEQAIVAGKKFTFVVNMPTMKGKTVKAEVLNSNGLPTGKMFDFTFNADGTREQQVQDGETLVLHGLSAGTHYTVTEKDQPAGFALTAVDGKTTDKAEGDIQQNKAQEHTFVNTYDVKAVDLAAADFVKYQKSFDRWDIAKEFELKLTGLDGAPMPEGTKASASSKTVKVSDGNTTGNFGKITFDKAGAFTYTVTEVRPQDLVAGVTYSAASYTVTVNVEDKNADGALDAPVVSVTKTVGDDGHELAKPESVADRTAAFTNSFNAESTKAAPQARKHYVDNSGKKPLADNMFEFSVKPTGDNAQQAPFPKTGLEADGSLHVRNAGESVSFPQVEFDAQHLGTFTYELKEVVPAVATDNHDGTYALDGMTYDGTVYTVEFKVESVDAGHDNAAKVRVTKTYKKNGAVVPEQDVVFNNAYNVTAAELPAQGDGAITVQKTLNGRDAKADEKFTFVMSAKLGDVATQQALKNNDIVLGDNDQLDTLEVQLGDLKNGQAATAGMGKVRFTKPGIYHFVIREKAPIKDAEGMKYDRHVCEVTVTVTDSKGALSAKIAYNNGKDASTANAAFVNTYASHADLSAAGAPLTVVKQLTGRDLKTEEFTFAMAGVDSDTVKAAEADKLLADTDREFKNNHSAADGKYAAVADRLNALAFTQADAGKTFSFSLKEVVPAEGKLAGVTYDRSEFRIDIKPVDNADGSMHFEETVWQVKDNKGAALDKPVEVVSVDTSKADTQKIVYAVFRNAYHADAVDVNTGDPAKTQFKFEKVLNGRAWQEGDSFRFTIEPDALTPNAPMPLDAAGKEVHEVTVSASAGTLAGEHVPFTFGNKITFTEAGTYKYVVREDAASPIAGIEYADTPAVATVVVSDPGNGKLNVDSITLEYETFTNTYKAQGSLADGGVSLDISKTLSGRDMQDGEFSFAIDGKGEASKAKLPKGVSNINMGAAADGTAATVNNVLDGLKFTQADAGKTFTFKIAEQVPQDAPLANVTYDKTYYELEVTVADNGDGTLKETGKLVKFADGTGKGETVDTFDTSVAGPKALTAAFKNTYTPDPIVIDPSNPGEGVTGSAEFTKTLEGRKWLDSDEFTFTLTPVDGAPMPQGKDGATAAELTAVVEAPRDKAQATVNFAFNGSFSFKREGTYKYNVVEKHTGETIKGLSYDADRTAPAQMIVDVTKSGDGKLHAAVRVENGAFKNIYKAGATDQVDISKATEGGAQLAKVLTGRNWKASDEFEFSITGSEGAPMPEPATVTLSGRTDASGTEVPFHFGKVSFDKAGIYTYEVREAKGAIAGVTYDEHAATITVEVTDDGLGKLKATVSIQAPVFNNTYKAASVVVTPTELGEGATFHKVLKGRDWLGTDAFEFSIKAVGDNADKAPKFEKQSVTLKDQKATEGQAVDFDFGGAEFKEVGTYTYEVSEKQGSIAGVTYAKDPRKLVVKVTDPGDGKLAATIEADGDDNTFTNTYKAGGVVIDPSKPGEGVTGSAAFAKVLEGRAWKESDSFTFRVSAKNPTDAPAFAKQSVTLSNRSDKAGAKVPFDFGKVSFDKVGTYTYEVREDSGSIAGVTYDGHVATITINVTDDGLGKLKADVFVDKPDFVNTYMAVAPTPEAGQSNVTFTKKLVGRDWHKGETFSFTMTGEDGAPMPVGSSNGTKTVEVAKPANGDIAEFGFGPIVYTFDHVKDAPQHTKQFVYTIHENIPAEGDRAPHLTYDNREVKLYVTVKDFGDGVLGASSFVENGAVDVTFVNTYKAELDFTKVANGAGLTAHKVLSGRDMTAGQFGISVAATGDNAAEAADKLGIAEGENGTQFAVPAGANGQDVAVDLLAHAKEKGGMKFTQDDLGKTFTYKIWESKGGEQGYANDTAEYTVAFTPVLSGKDELQVKVTRTATDGAQAQGPTEIIVPSQDAAEGIRADFLNTYKAEGNAQNGSGSVALTAAKKLSGRPLQAGEFSFKCALVNAKTGQVENVFAREATNDDAGKIDFGTITFNSDELNKLADDGKIGRTVDATNGNATWTIKMRAWELTDNLPAGVSAVDDRVDFTITVTDNGNGTLSKPQIGPEGAKLEFVNNYTAGGVDPEGNPTDGKTSLVLKGAKTLNTVDGGLQQSEIAGKFSFTLAPVTEGAPMPAKATVTNDAAGNVDFGAIEFTFDNLNEQLGKSAARSGKPRSFDYVYNVTESGSLPGVANDAAATKTVTITVTDDGEGRLTAAVKDVAAGLPAFAFVNTYAIGEGGKPSVSPTDNGEGRFNVTKRLEGRELQAGEFSFELVENATGKVVAEGVNDAEGNVELGKIKFTEPGTRAFTLRERKGDKGGVTYSTVEYAVTAQAVDNHKGALEVTFTARDAAGKEVKDLVFTNTYKADPTSLQINAVKVLAGEGAKLESGQFEFVIENADSKRTEITKAHNGEATNNVAPVEFQPIPLDKVGDYHLTMREVKGKDAQIVYDDSVVDVTFTVVDDQNGKLVVKDNAVKYAVNGKPVEQPVFRNEFHAIIDGLPLGPGHIDAMDLKPAQKHEPAKKPADKNKLVQTGDNAGIGIALVAAAGVAVLGGGLLIKRRSNR